MRLLRPIAIATLAVTTRSFPQPRPMSTAEAPTAQGNAETSRRFGSCDAPINHLLDFWIGDWDVYAAGKLDGHDRIPRQLEGCAITEEWADAGGGHG